MLGEDEVLALAGGVETLVFGYAETWLQLPDQGGVLVRDIRLDGITLQLATPSAGEEEVENTDDDAGIGPGTWLTFVSQLEGKTLNAQLLRFNGPPLDAVWDPDKVTNSIVGSLTLDLLGADKVRFCYGIDGVNGSLDTIASDSATVSGSRLLQPFAVPR